MIGDGATDMQARPPAKAFIGYGGIIEREKVKNGADWFIKDFNEILSIL
jgi:phosphoserine phosphatase